jgi:hypothetical protein
MAFRSKVDWWLQLVLLAGAVVALACGALALRSNAGWMLAALTVLAGAALPLWILVSTKYTVSPGSVLMQSGPFRWRIPANGITGIAPTRSVLSSPALSLDRLRIDYEDGRKSLMVSPLEKEEFMRAVQAAGGSVRDATSHNEQRK